MWVMGPWENLMLSRTPSHPFLSPPETSSLKRARPRCQGLTQVFLDPGEGTGLFNAHFNGAVSARFSKPPPVVH